MAKWWWLMIIHVHQKTLLVIVMNDYIIRWYQIHVGTECCLVMRYDYWWWIHELSSSYLILWWSSLHLGILGINTLLFAAWKSCQDSRSHEPPQVGHQLAKCAKCIWASAKADVTGDGDRFDVNSPQIGYSDSTRSLVISHWLIALAISHHESKVDSGKQFWL